MTEWSVSRETIEPVSEPVLARLRAPIERALRDARIHPDGLSQIVLAGGASHKPMLRRMPALNIDPATRWWRGVRRCARHCRCAMMVLAGLFGRAIKKNRRK